MATQTPGPPMTLGNMRSMGARLLMVLCLNPTIIAAVLAATLISAPAQSADSDPVISVISACLSDPNDVTPAQINCLRTALANVEREMNTAYQWRLGVTDASYRRQLASVQRLWAQSMQANCDFFGGNPGSAARLQCRIKEMIERTQTLKALD
jgi:uncharacterized protein YecT (DUF1311 family)